jgi:hypothetical protein
MQPHPSTRRIGDDVRRIHIMASTSYLKLFSLFAEQGPLAIGLSMELHGARFARTLSVIKITDDLIIKQEIETSKLKTA